MRVDPNVWPVLATMAHGCTIGLGRRRRRRRSGKNRRPPSLLLPVCRLHRNLARRGCILLVWTSKSEAIRGVAIEAIAIQTWMLDGRRYDSVQTWRWETNDVRLGLAQIQLVATESISPLAAHGSSVSLP